MKRLPGLIVVFLFALACKHAPAVGPAPSADSGSSKSSGLSLDADKPHGVIPDNEGSDRDLSADSFSALQPVFFDYDSSEIRQDQIPSLQSDSKLIRAKVSSRFLIEGHCDERGTEEYNLALGSRRAEMTKDYLISLGIPENRLATISYGENRPFAKGHSESDWQQNRRAQLLAQN